MKVGAPFNPYRVFQGVFAPYWLLEHEGISTGAKLCYIRLLGFAGRDARCYPSLDTLGSSLAVSARQARDYVKELQRASLITVEQRGLRKTNVYLFLWTDELEALNNSVPSRPGDPDGPERGSRTDVASDRNYRSDPDRSTSALDRNSCSALDRNPSAVLDRNGCSAPIGINSEGNSSLESCSSPAAVRGTTDDPKSVSRQRPDFVAAEPTSIPDRANRLAQAISEWVIERRIQRLRSDRRVGPPEKEELANWAAILENGGVRERDQVFSALDQARIAADGFGAWRNWEYLTIQIQLAAERFYAAQRLSATTATERNQINEDPHCHWATIKAIIRSRLAETPYTNWFAPTTQTERDGTALTVAVPDEPTRWYLASEYDDAIHEAASSVGIDEVRFVVEDANTNGKRGIRP